MKRINLILVLLLAITLVAAPVSTSAANAVPMSASNSGASGSSFSNDTAADTNNAPAETECTGQGDPGGAGDGLGVDPESLEVGGGPDGGTGPAMELLLQLLRLMQAAG